MTASPVAPDVRAVAGDGTAASAGTGAGPRPRGGRRATLRLGLPALGLACMAAVLLLPFGLAPYYVDLASKILIFGLFAMSLDLLVGYTGLWSLGHAAFFGVAAYTTGLLALHGMANPLEVMGLSLLVTLAVAAPFGLLVLRSQGLYFLMITLAVAQLLWGVAFSWQGFTGGDNGLPGVPRPAFASLGWTAQGHHAFYLFVLVWFAVGTLLMVLVARSPFGLTLQGIRESDLRMWHLGHNVWLHRYLVYVVAALFAGLAGSLFAYHNGIVTPGDLNVSNSAEALLMVILGGAGTLYGPFVGSVVVVLMENLVSTYTARWLSFLGAAYVLVVVLAPEGLAPRLRRGLVGLFAGARGVLPGVGGRGPKPGVGAGDPAAEAAAGVGGPTAGAGAGGRSAGAGPVGGAGS